MRWLWLSVVGLVIFTGCTTVEPPKETRVEPARSMVAAPPSADPVWPADAPAIHAKYAIMIDARTGRTLYQKNADVFTQVASTQKLMTALIVAESGNLDRIVTIQPSDTAVEPTKLGVRSGQSYSRLRLLSAMLVKSENDAAAALARDHSGSLGLFAIEMNQKARAVGADDSLFLNPHGLPAAQHSTARDMAKIAFRAYHQPLIRQLVAMPYYSFTFSTGRTVLLQSTNKLLGHSSICNGMKTGFTNAAGRCLVSSASYGGRDVILAQLGSKTTYIFNDAETMMQWGLRRSAPFVASY